MEKIDGKTLNLTNINIKKLKELFPEVVVDGKIDFEKLKLILGDEIDSSNERYQFSWNGKQNSIRFSRAQTTSSLLPHIDLSVNWNTTNNLYLEGDNLEVLKLLQKTYFGKIKMIYIDPPYNTGHDFVYNDNFKDTIHNYKEITSQLTRANPDTNGRYHTNWLNMMYSRLLLTRNLLTDDGVVFISMADTELKNLLNICEEIYSKDNIEILVWKKKSSAGNTEKILGVLTEYIICCFKNKQKGCLNYKKINRNYSFNDEIGPYNLEGLEKTNLGTYSRPTMLFEVVDPKTGISFKPGKDLRWTIGKETFDQMIKENKIFFDYKNNRVKRIKRPEDYEESENVYYNLLDSHGSLASAKDELGELIGNREIFDTPKPVSLIKHLIELSTRKDSIILDFFSGSSTTAHAVMQLNAEDNGIRKFIMVQLPELCEENSEAYKHGYKNICEIGEERIRRAGKKIYNELKEKYDNAGLLIDYNINPDNLDFGFKVFKLESTNIKPWDSQIKVDENTIFNFTDTIKEDRTNLDVAYEIMLKYGIFNMPLEEIQINNKTMYSIGDKFMIICLDNDINENDVIEIANLKPTCVVFKENGFKDDNEKMNATYTLERFGVTDVKCI